MNFYCPNCNTPYSMDGAVMGRKALCQNCNTKFYITDKVPTTIVDARHDQGKTAVQSGAVSRKIIRLAVAGLITLALIIAASLLYFKFTDN